MAYKFLPFAMSSLPLDQLLPQMILIPSVSTDIKACKEILLFCEQYVSDLPVEFHRYECNGHHSMVVSYKEKLTPKIMFIAHLDVVPAPPQAFVPRTKDGKLFGRGAYDMKGPAAVSLNAFRAHVESGSNVSLGIMLTTDEEIGGKSGVKHLLDNEGFRPECAVLPDGGGNFSVVKLQYGILRLDILRRGKAAHSSRPEDGDNAIHSFIKDFEVFKNEIAKIPETIMSIVDIRAGIALNVTPDLCDAKIDIRTAHHDQVKAVAAQCFRAGEYEYIDEEPVFRTDPTHPLIAAYIAASQAELGKPANLTVERGASDGRFLTPHNIPGIVTICLGGGHHQDTEWIDLESMKVLERIFGRYLQSLQ